MFVAQPGRYACTYRHRLYRLILTHVPAALVHRSLCRTVAWLVCRGLAAPVLHDGSAYASPLLACTKPIMQEVVVVISNTVQRMSWPQAPRRDAPKHLFCLYLFDAVWRRGGTASIPKDDRYLMSVPTRLLARRVEPGLKSGSLLEWATENVIPRDQRSVRTPSTSPSSFNLFPKIAVLVKRTTIGPSRRQDT